jgi:hypothetical protein
MRRETTPEDLPREGQGRIAGHNPEHLGTTDAKVVVCRRIWLREVAAMLEDRRFTQWKIPAEPFAIAGRYGYSRTPNRR